MDKSRSSAISSALSRIRKQREGKTSALDEYEVQDENEKIYEVVTAEEYKERTSKRRLDDFIEGGEVFSDDDYVYDSDSGDESRDESGAKRQLPDGYGKSIQQHFTEIAKKESMPYKRQKDHEADRKLIEKLSKFEDDLDNDDVSLNPPAATMIGKMPMSMGIRTGYMPQPGFPQYTQYQPYPMAPVQLDPRLNIEAKREEPTNVDNDIPSSEQNPETVAEEIAAGLDINQILEEADKLSGSTPVELDNSIVEDFGEMDDTSMEIITTSSPSNQVSQDFDQPLSQDSQGTAFYLLDAYEDSNALLRLFGKLHRAGSSAESCVVTVREFMRCLFFKARMDLDFTDLPEGEGSYERAFMKRFFTEFEEIRKSYGIKKIKYKLVKRKLLRYGPSEEGLYVKVCYSFSFPKIRPEHYSGASYSDVFGVTASQVELFLVKRKIKGPSWLRLMNASLSKDRISTCKHELDVPNHKSVSLWEAGETGDLPIPTLCIASVSVKTFFASPTHQEVLQIAMIYDKDCPIDASEIRRLNLCKQYIGIRKVRNNEWPQEMRSFLEKRPYFRVFEQERGLLANFMKTLEVIDPDVVIGHDLSQNVSEVLLKRCNMLNIPLRVSFSRLRPTKKHTTPFHAGRIFCDTRVLTKELHHNRSNYDLSSCVSELVYGAKIKDSSFYIKNSFTTKELAACFGDQAMKELLTLAQANSKCSLDAFNLLLKLQALPLTKELTNIAGNLWSRSVQCARSERNDFLLLHEFHRAKYIIDHNFERQNKQNASNSGTEEDEDKSKKSYEGGLVLEPISGLYDTFVLLLDFNSLYPSIIQEFNVCFTTVRMLEDGNVEVLNDVPGMLPQILKRLVELRASVKAVLATEKNAARKVQLGVRQLALKLVANSLYGCLGSVYSRFHARHMAAYITQQGRMVLQSTRDKVEKQFSLRVIYGDTDSLMIDTNIKDDGSETAFETARQIAGTLMGTINKSHRKLEIGMDGIFNRLLLLKKKKYAALKVVNFHDRQFAREIKGLDFIRRDWSILTKEVGNALLGIILNDKQNESSSEGVESIVDQIHETLREVNRRIAEEDIPPKAWVITRQLARNPKDYATNSNLPHVTVALRMNESGASYSAGHEVPFIICSKESIENSWKSEKGETDGKEETDKPSVDLRILCNRAYSLVEFQQKGLKADIGYYKSQQLLPPIMRLCGVIAGTDPQKLAMCLQIEDKVHQNILSSNSGSFDHAEQEAKALSLINKTRERYRDVEMGTTVTCQFCNTGVIASYFLKHMRCSNCANRLPIHAIRNWITRTIYEISMQSSFCIRVCNICNTTTPNVCIGNTDMCPQATCQSRDAMEVVLPASKIYLYYEYLIYMLEGDLTNEGGSSQEDTLVNVTMDVTGKTSVLANPAPFRPIRTLRDILNSTVKMSNLRATSGFRVCGQYILGILEAMPFLQYYTLDYRAEREELCSLVKQLQQRNSYSVVTLQDVFSLFASA